MPTMTPHDQSDLVDRIGEVVRAGGSTLDARVRERPPILGQVTIAGASPDAFLTAQVAQYLDDDLVRCFPVGNAPANSLAAPAGAAVQDTGERTSLPMELPTLRRAIGHMRHENRPATILETGIKAIDLCCPIGPGAVVGLIGDMHVGKMVLAGELVHRLTAVDPPVSLVVLVEATTEALAIESLEYRTSPSVEAIYLPVADASPEALAPILDQFDTTIVLNRELGTRRLYPAIDPLRSSSRLLDPAVAGTGHLATLETLRSALANDPDATRSDLLRHYLSQPFFTTEPWTNRPGQTVPLATTMADVETILSGSVDDLVPESLYLTGALGA